MVTPEKEVNVVSGSLADALNLPETLKSFDVVDEDELRRIMAELLEKWRVFLHPTQRGLSTRQIPALKGSWRCLYQEDCCCYASS